MHRSVAAAVECDTASRFADIITIQYSKKNVAINYKICHQKIQRGKKLGNFGAISPYIQVKVTFFPVCWYILHIWIIISIIRTPSLMYKHILWKLLKKLKLLKIAKFELKCLQKYRSLWPSVWYANRGTSYHYYLWNGKRMCL